MLLPNIVFTSCVNKFKKKANQNQPVAHINQAHIQQISTQPSIQSQAQQQQQIQQQHLQQQQQQQQQHHHQQQHHQQNQYQPQVSISQPFQQQNFQPQNQQQLQQLQQQQSSLQQQLVQQQSQLINNPLLTNLPNIPSSQNQINLQGNLVQVPLNMQAKFPSILNASNQPSSLSHVNIKPVQLVNNNPATAPIIPNKNSQFDENDINFNSNINKQQQHVTLDSPMVQFRRPMPPTSPPQMPQGNQMESVSVHSNLAPPPPVTATIVSNIPSLTTTSSTSNPTNTQTNAQQQQQQLEATSKMEKTLQNDRLEQLEQQIGNVFQHAPPQPSIIGTPMVGVTSVTAVNVTSSSVQPQVHSQIINQSQQQSTTLTLNQQNIS